MVEAWLLLWKGGHDEDRLAALAGDDPAGGEAAAVADALDLEQDRLARIAGQQEIGVQRMGRAAVDRALRGDERLGEHLPAKDPLPAVLRRMADEAIFACRLEIEQRDKFVSGHRFCTPDAPTVYSFAIACVNAGLPRS